MDYMTLDVNEQALESNLIVFSNVTPTNLAYYENLMPYLPLS